MKRFRKSLILLLSVVLAVISFTACNPNDTDDADGVCKHAFVLDEVCTTSFEGVPMSAFFKCGKCDETQCRSLTYEDIDMPILNLTGSMEGVSKENKITVGVEYRSEKTSFDCSATIKWQGSSSLAYPKKNYTIQLYKESDLKKKNKVELYEGWGQESKYCLKANYIDYSQARNVVSAKLHGDISRTRDTDDEFAALVNGGTIDGFPVAIYHDGDFLGLYTLNIPKDEWLFGMDDDENARQAILMGDDWTNSVALRENMKADYSNGWELEFCSTKDDSWVAESFNTMMNFVNNNDGDAFKRGISEYVNLDRTIDTMLSVYSFMATDGTSKNLLWVTYDGKVWTSVPYDMDTTWGIGWNGTWFDPYSHMCISKDKNGLGNNLWDKIYKNFRAEVITRYFQLRKTSLSLSNITNRFTQFEDGIHPLVKQAESSKWTDVPSKNQCNTEQILTFAKQHLEYTDSLMR